jgi:hypothetical protein
MEPTIYNSFPVFHIRILESGQDTPLFIILVDELPLLINGIVARVALSPKSQRPEHTDCKQIRALIIVSANS